MKRFFFCSIVLVVNLRVFAQAGSLDPTFGNGGIVWDIDPAYSSFAGSVLVQADGKILIAGGSEDTNQYFALARYQEDGSPDAGFGVGGKVITDIGYYTSNAISDMALQADGKIITIGRVYIGGAQWVALVRYNPDGSLDNTFDTDGFLFMNLGSFIEGPQAIAVQDDGKIVFTERAADFIVVRLNEDGTPDNSFDGDGIAVTDFDGGNDFVRDISIQPDGKIVATGVVISSTLSLGVIGVARYNSNGSPDNTFSTDGKVMTNIGTSSAHGYAILIAPTGKIIIGGVADNETGDKDFIIHQYNANGSDDMTFGINGTAWFDYLGLENALTEIALQEDGKILATGRSVPASDFIAVRFIENGTIDNSFSGDGIVTVSANDTTSDYSNAITIQPDGKIILAGTTESDFMVIRLMAESFVSLESQSSTGLLNTFPNPTVTGEFTVSVPEYLNQVTVKIMDLNGRIVLQESGLSGTHFSFSLSDHESGIYLVEIHAQQVIYRSKVVRN